MNLGGANSRKTKKQWDMSKDQVWFALKGMIKNWVFATNLNFLIPKSLHPSVVNSWYFKHRLFDLTEYIVWNIKGLRHRVA